MKIILSRKNKLLNRIRTYKVLIDGKEAGTIANGKVEEFELTNGTHTLVCKLNWYYSNEYECSNASDTIIYLSIQNGMKGIWLSYVLFFVYFIFLFISPDVAHSFGGNGKWIKIFFPTILVAYFLYYATLGRKQYLKLEKDTTNVFVS